MWKPTKPGQYLLEGQPVTVAIRSDLSLCIFRQGSTVAPDVYEALWSLLLPDWQPGAPTPEQLSRWPWWSIQTYDGSMMIDKIEDGTESVGYLRMCGGLEIDPEHIIRSAPIQPAPLGNGPLWVPLEVCK